MKKTLLRLPNLLLPALILLLGAATSCNSKSESVDDEPAVTISTVAIKSFNLKADTKVLTNLDSVFFSIDLDKGIIFNADSLPKGTKISRLIPVINFQSAMTEAKLIIDGGTEKNDTINYLTNSTDSVDFTKKVTLNVTALDGTSKYTYRIKVNVHTQEPDSLMWSELDKSPLPSRFATPVAQKTVKMGGSAYSLIKENDNTLTMAVSDNLLDKEWTRTPINLPFEADIRSLEATEKALWLLASDGALYTSADGISWTPTREKWSSIIGAYLDSVLGIKDTTSGLTHCHYPANDLITDTAVDPQFPLSGRSAFRTFSSQWTPNPTGVFAGGVTAAGEATSNVWAFDGSRWAIINSNALPEIQGMTMVKYVIYRKLDTSIQQKYYEVLLAFAGKKSDGSLNRDVYISYDNGVNWKKASSLLQFPSYVPSLFDADGIVMSSSLDGNLENSLLTRASVKPSFTLDGYEITWDCPFIYIFGGMDSQSTLSETVWRGVMARLRFIPVI